MKVKDLIKELKKLDQDAEVLIPDQHYGEEGSMSTVDSIQTAREYTTLSVVELGV
jgi:hypothetical protein